jgi:glycerol-3-phosphate dehydrogenase
VHYADLLRPVTGSDEVLEAEIACAVNEEMAVRLDDAVRRRTILGSGEQPKPETLAACAALMGGLLNWSKERQEEEIARCVDFYL